jgi:trans-aconitate methyltransferase
MKTLLDIIHEKNLNNVTHPEFGTDKEYDHMYCTGFYDKEFLKYKDKQIIITEVGIAKGGSIVLWDEYFDDAHIIGIDNREQGAKENTKHLDNVQIVYADAYSETFVESLPMSDIIIEDGSHHFVDQVKSIQLYLSKLKPGGVFIIEDIAKMEYCDEFKKYVPESMTYEVVDVRDISPEPDSILFVVRN